MTSTNGPRKRTAAAKPRKRNAERSRQLILETALKHFAAKGYDGARIDDIVAETNLSKNLLYHYFGSKEALFVAVLETVYERFRGRHGGASIADLPPIEALRHLVDETARALIATPEIISILNTENLYRATHIKKSKKIRSIYDPLFVDLNRVLEKGKATGEIRDNIDAVQLYISLSSLIYHYLSNGHTLSVVLKQDLMTKANLATRIKHVTDMVLRFCLPPELLAKA
jgi:TetR/AcrR family transcriptional regulator